MTPQEQRNLSLGLSIFCPLAAFLAIFIAILVLKRDDFKKAWKGRAKPKGDIEKGKSQHPDVAINGASERLGSSTNREFGRKPDFPKRTTYK